jgi:hypothetical protein
MLTNSDNVEMQYFITYANNKQVVVPKQRWKFTPGVLSGLHIGDNGNILYR